MASRKTKKTNITVPSAVELKNLLTEHVEMALSLGRYGNIVSNDLACALDRVRVPSNVRQAINWKLVYILDRARRLRDTLTMMNLQILLDEVAGLNAYLGNRFNVVKKPSYQWKVGV